MTDDMMDPRRSWRRPRCRYLREMIGFAAERLMELEVGAATGAAYGEKSPLRIANATVIATGTGRRGPAPSSCASPNSGKAPIIHRS